MPRTSKTITRAINAPPIKGATGPESPDSAPGSSVSGAVEDVSVGGGGGGRRRGLPTERFKRLEDQMRQLKKAQLRRRAGKQYTETVDEEGNVQVKVVQLDKIAPVPVKRVLAPVVIPPRLDDDLHYVERKFPKAAKQRAKLKETGSDIDRLRAEAVAATKLVNKANTDILRAEKRRDFLRNELANLVFQDDIMEKRRRRGELIEEEKERLEEREQEIRECVLVRGLVWFGLVGLVWFGSVGSGRGLVVGVSWTSQVGDGLGSVKRRCGVRLVDELFEPWLRKHCVLTRTCTACRCSALCVCCQVLSVHQDVGADAETHLG